MSSATARELLTRFKCCSRTKARIEWVRCFGDLFAPFSLRVFKAQKIPCKVGLRCVKNYKFSMESVDLKQININSIITLPKLVCIIIYKLKNTNYKIEISSSVLKATDCELKTVTHSNSQFMSSNSHFASSKSRGKV